MSGMMLAVMGSGGDLVQLNDASATAYNVDPADSTAGYKIVTTGEVSETDGGGAYSVIGQAVTPGANTGNYEVQMTVNSGSLTGGTTGSWVALTLDREWTLTQTIVGTSTANCTIEIRRAGTTTVINSATVTFSATVDL